MRFFYLFSIVSLLFAACDQGVPDVQQTHLSDPGKPSSAAVDSVLNDWHQAAAEADFDRYFGHFASDTAIFIGTDATERWTVAEFKPWSKPYFDRGQAWSFTAEERHVYFSENGRTAWFDEELATPNLGPARGSGVLQLTDQGWKIVHYNLSVPIPNAIVEDVVRQIDSALQTASEEVENEK